MKLTIELSEIEYADLCRKAEEERRSPEQMAEWLVVKGEKITPWPYPVYTTPRTYPYWGPTIIMSSTMADGTALPNNETGIV